jgi:hypothetical protein
MASKRIPIRLTEGESSALVAFLLSLQVNGAPSLAMDIAVLMKPFAERVSKAWTGQPVEIGHRSGGFLLMLLDTVRTSFKRRGEMERFYRRMRGVRRKLLTAGFRWTVKKDVAGLFLGAFPADLPPRPPRKKRRAVKP